MISLIQQLFRSLQEPTTAKRYRDAGIGLAFTVGNQLVVLPIQITLNLHSINIPASILVMLLCLFLMVVANYIHGGTAELYSKHIRGPTDFLGRHMSYGFVASFIMLNRDHISDAIAVPKIAGVFLVTTLASYACSFLVAWGSFDLEQRVRGQRTKSFDLESNKSWPSPSTAWPTPSTDRASKPLSHLSRISVALVKNGSLTSIESTEKVSTPQFIDLIVHTAPLWICVLLIGVVGIPAYFATNYETPFEVLCFILFWILSVQFQRSLRNSCRLLQHPRLRSTLVILTNPVMISWALGSAYLWIKTAYTHHTIATVVTEFRRHTTLAEGMAAILGGGSIKNNIGAGDLSGPVLDAGIICLGFKMFEYRKELWESFTTVLTTCALLAIANVFLNVMIGRAMGLEAADAIAFAARSVTIALGVPAIQNLGGSTTLMSATVIFGGIIFQMAGDWVFSLLRINDRACQQNIDDGGSSNGEKIGDEKESQKITRVEGGEIAIVAAGITVGINAAAMGTSHLIERDSKATAYSALSMTVFGAMTVALTALPGVSGSITFLASR
ncbi:uncharacterized protein F4822DRAFT_373628 [Hypoxylon trugodes]|uniref:uncharacterized protein n=1 Tax=Hypoxylon trugodes TaxID=326681 RepID=UPI00218CF7F6|nr:uncharacterized protein F4822DRAFT_373628 [Hypoxylon trugodes]KAI1384801.1 hypothetical protein F4822DRAFT_373628 [Hypoxylon trugodes]